MFLFLKVKSCFNSKSEMSLERICLYREVMNYQFHQTAVLGVILRISEPADLNMSRNVIDREPRQDDRNLHSPSHGTSLLSSPLTSPAQSIPFMVEPDWWTQMSGWCAGSDPLDIHNRHSALAVVSVNRGDCLRVCSGPFLSNPALRASRQEQIQPGAYGPAWCWPRPRRQDRVPGIVTRLDPVYLRCSLGLPIGNRV